MKVKSILVLSVLFITVLSAVSAADNATMDNVTAADDVSISEDINVTFDDCVWKEDLGDINVTLPEEAEGNFALKINDEVLYNQTITNKSFKIPITLPTNQPEFYITIYPPIDSRTYKISAFYNGIDLNITTPLKVMNYPPDYNMLSFPKEILKGDSYIRILAFPRSANGTVGLYIDDKLYNTTIARTIYWSKDNPFSKLSLGNHTFKVIYYGDRYYKPYTKTFNFTITDVVINIPQTLNIGHDDCISVETHENVKGNVKVYIDGRLIADSKIENGDFLISLEEYVRYTDLEIKVIFTSKDFSRNKTQAINMTYDFDFYYQRFTYGEENTLEVILPDTLNNKLLTFKIDGVECKFTHPKNIMNNILEYDISNLPSGNHTLYISYKGDSKFYPLERTYNFTIDYRIHAPWSVNYKSDSKVYLKLPADAKGNLVVTIDGKLYKSVKLKKGYAEVIVNTLAPGRYVLEASYSGDDYNVTEINTRVYANARINYNYGFTAGENEYITFEVPKDCKGYVIFHINEKDYKVQIKNGIARYSLKNLKAGEYEVDIDYYGNDGYNDISNWLELKIYKPKIRMVTSQVSFNGVDINVKVLTKKGKAIANKVVSVKFNGKTYKIKTNKKGVLIFKKKMKLKNKKYTLKITYKGAKLTKKFRAAPFYLKLSKTGKKLTVTAVTNKKVKNQIVTFKIKSKTYKVNTNSKGIAKLTIKKPKKTPSIKATYLKNTVKI